MGRSHDTEEESTAQASLRTGGGAWRGSLIAFLLGVAAMTYVQWSTYEPAGRDSFYHVKMAVLLPQIGFPDKFHWLRHTILNENNVSHHHGFHIMMIPFVYGSQWLADAAPGSWHEWAGSGNAARSGIKVALRSWLQSPYILGGKVFIVLMFGVVVFAADRILRRMDVGFRWFWLLALLALPTDFYLRMGYIRAPIVSLVILLLVFDCCVRGRYVWVGILGALYCHVYGGFIFHPIIVAAVGGSFAVFGGEWQKLLWLTVACFVGLGIGMLTHPYFPENISFLNVQLFETGLQTAAVEKVRVGSEWKPIHLDYWLQTSAFTLIVFGLSVVLRFNWRRLLHPETVALLLLNFLFLGLCLWARRFIEYWPMFCLLSAASLWRGFDAKTSEVGRAVSEALPEIHRSMRRVYRRTYVSMCLVALAVAVVTLTLTRESVRCKFDIRSIKKAMAFLEENTRLHSLVFADDWDEFPMYFYYNHHNDYVCGLDPQFTNSIDPVLWKRFCVITQGKSPRTSTVKVRVREGLGSGVLRQAFRVQISDIKTEFGADYVLVDKDHQSFYRKLKAEPDLFEHVYPPHSGTEPPARVAALAVFAVLDPPSDAGLGDPVSRETEPLPAAGE
ncbi:MAG: hypothetical protein IIB58_06540 [Planctomycetes bacterium]|nr:hypothetical protein [Planctomycetota bacterium]